MPTIEVPLDYLASESVVCSLSPCYATQELACDHALKPLRAGRVRRLHGNDTSWLGQQLSLKTPTAFGIKRIATYIEAATI